MSRLCLSLIFFLLLHANAWTQNNGLAGTWQLANDAETNSGLSMQLQVASPINGCFYPAQLSIRYQNFEGTYQLLLLQKSVNEFAISRNKFAVSEKPFSLGNWLVAINGTVRLNLTAAELTIERWPLKKYGVPLPPIMNYAEADRSTIMNISDLFRYAPMTLKKIAAQPWLSADAGKLVHSQQSPVYMGILDTFYTNEAKAHIRFAENKQTDEDSISVLLNGKNLLQNAIINDLKGSRKITLDTGLNILIVFAENYGRVPPNTASLGVQLAEKNFSLDFTTPQNASATFMLAKIFYYPDKKRSAAQSDLTKQQIAEKINQRKTVVIDSISVQSSEITLAIWDDAVDDGDSISLQINNDISFTGIPVKKQPRFFKVTLTSGTNHIVFMADNLGSIAPNTAMLELIEGKKRKSYHINTSLGLNNAIRIRYDVPAPK